MHSALVAKLDAQRVIYLAAKEADDKEAQARSKSILDALLDKLAAYHGISAEDI